MTDHRDVWDAVDRLTKPRREKVDRGGDATSVDDLEKWFTELAAAQTGACNVPTYRAAQAAYQASTAKRGTIPSLWDQSTLALYGSEQAAGRGSKPLRERSIADLDLMEIRALIRDTTRRQLEERNVHTAQTTNGPAPFDPNEIRRLASLVTGDPDEDHDWWRYRFDQWGRLLETYLHAAEHQARPVRLRNSPCPACGARQVALDEGDEHDRPIVPALLIDFRDGYVRAAECTNCGQTWFRGDQLEALARELGCHALDTRDDTQVARTA